MEGKVWNPFTTTRNARVIRDLPKLIILYADFHQTKLLIKCKWNLYIINDIDLRHSVTHGEALIELTMLRTASEYERADSADRFLRTKRYAHDGPRQTLREKRKQLLSSVHSAALNSVMRYSAVL